MNDLLAGTSLIIGIAAANAAQDKIGFKEFLESTPVIEELVYEVSMPANPSFIPQSYFVRWQNGAYVVRRSPKLSWVTVSMRVWTREHRSKAIGLNLFSSRYINSGVISPKTSHASLISGLSMSMVLGTCQRIFRAGSGAFG